MLDGYFTVEEASKKLINARTGKYGISIAAVHQLIRREKLKTERMGNRHLLHLDTIIARNVAAKKFYEFHDAPSRQKSSPTKS